MSVYQQTAYPAQRPILTALGAEYDGIRGGLINRVTAFQQQYPDDLLNNYLLASWAGPGGNWVSGALEECVNVTATLIDNTFDGVKHMRSFADHVSYLIDETYEVAKALTYHRPDLPLQVKNDILAYGGQGMADYLNWYTDISNQRASYLNSIRQPSKTIQRPVHGFQQRQPAYGGYQQSNQLGYRQQGMTANMVQRPTNGGYNSNVNRYQSQQQLGYNSNPSDDPDDVTAILMNGRQRASTIPEPKPYDVKKQQTTYYSGGDPIYTPSKQTTNPTLSYQPKAEVSQKPTQAKQPDLNPYFKAVDKPAKETVEVKDSDVVYDQYGHALTSEQVTERYGRRTERDSAAFNYPRNDQGLLADEQRFLSRTEAEVLLEMGQATLDPFHKQIYYGETLDTELFITLTKSNTIRQIRTNRGEFMPNVPEYANALKEVRDKIPNCPKSSAKLIQSKEPPPAAHIQEATKRLGQALADADTIKDVQEKIDIIDKSVAEYNHERREIIRRYAQGVTDLMARNPNMTLEEAYEKLGVPAEVTNASELIDIVEEKRMEHISNYETVLSVNSPTEVKSELNAARLENATLFEESVFVTSQRDKLDYVSQNLELIQHTKDLLSYFYYNRHDDNGEVVSRDKRSDGLTLHKALSIAKAKLPTELFLEINSKATAYVNRYLKYGIQTELRIDDFTEDFMELQSHILSDEETYPNGAWAMATLHDHLWVMLSRYTYRSELVAIEVGVDPEVDWVQHKAIVSTTSFNAAYIARPAVQMDIIKDHHIVDENTDKTLYRIVTELAIAASQSMLTETPIRHSYIIYSDNTVYEIIPYVDIKQAPSENANPFTYVLVKITP